MPDYFLSDQSYLALKVETSEGVAVRPNVFLPLESESLATNRNLQADRRMAGRDWETDDLSPQSREHSGAITVWADPDTIGYILNMTMVKGSTTGSSGDGYTHPFTPGNPKTYTIEIPRGPYAQRFFGVKGDTLRLFIDGAKLKAEVNVAAMGQFSVGKLLADMDAADIVLSLNQEYDLLPNRGLVVGDVIVVGDGTANKEELTLTSVNANGQAVGFNACANDHDAGELVYLKKQTVSNGVLQRPLMFGDLVAGFGATASAAETAAGSRATATKIHEVTIEYSNTLLKAPTSSYMDPTILLPQQKTCVATIRQLFTLPDQLAAWQQTVKQAISFIFNGKIINPATPTQNQLKITLHKALLESNDEPVVAGQYIMDEQSFRAAYDDGDSKAVSVELINKIATY